MRAKIVASWDRRARAYDRLTRRWPLFSRMAERLVRELPPGFEGSVLDLAGGTGLLSAMLLRLPGAAVTLCEPAPAMRRLARARLGARVRLRALPAERLCELGGGYGAVLCNAAFHLFETAPALEGAAAVLKPGGIFAFNLWPHAWEPLSAQSVHEGWEGPLRRALEEAGLPSEPREQAPAPLRLSPRELSRLAERAGFSLRRVEIDADPSDGALAIDFMAMSPNWPQPGLGARRAGIIRRARELAAGPRRALSARVRLVRRPG